MQSGTRVKMAVDFWKKFAGQTGTVITKSTGLACSYVIKWDDASLDQTLVLAQHLEQI